jgi:hypothetical protein
VTVRTYSNQKPWITGNIRTELKAWATAFKEWNSNLEPYKKSSYAIRWTIKQAKRQYRTKIESYFTGSDASQMWQGLTVWSRSPQPMWVRPLNRSTFTGPQGQLDYQNVYCKHALTNRQVSSLTFSTSLCLTS